MTLTITSSLDIAICQRLRRIVFIEEQSVPRHIEVDGLDDSAHHLPALWDGQPMGTARLLILSDAGKIGRVCVIKSLRGVGLGAALIRAGVDQFRGLPGILRVKLGAQIHATGFYERLGFHSFGEEYMDAGIVHQDMELRL